jgi:hypothetical protein
MARRRIAGTEEAPKDEQAPAGTAEVAEAPKAEKPLTDAEAKAAADALMAPPPVDRAPSPVATPPRVGGGFHRLQTVIIDESVDPIAEYEVLEKALMIEEALTPENVRQRVNEVEKYAARAHRLFVLCKVQIARYQIDADAAMSSMRDQAVAELTLEKNKGLRSKQVTDDDVTARCATIHPDEWKELNDQMVKNKAMLGHIERFADLWQRRSWSLSSLNS